MMSKEIPVSEQPQPAGTAHPPAGVGTPTISRVLAIDLGERRMGLALSDPLRLTAQGLPTVERRNRRQDMNYLKSLVRRHEVSEIVLGDPINMDGTAGPQSRTASEFAEKLRKHLGLEVHLWDERLTSVEANRILTQAGVAPERRAGSVDQLSAVLILESYLEARRSAAERGGGRTPLETSG